MQQFNPALGSLESVYLAVIQTVDIDGAVQNNSTGPQSFTVRAGSMLTVALPGGLGYLQPSPLAVAQTYNLAAGATAPYGPIHAGDSVNYTFTSPADIALFIGTGTITLPGFTQTQELISGGGGNIIALLNTLSAATVEVCYTNIPEPGPLALLALGGAVLLLRKRR